MNHYRTRGRRTMRLIALLLSLAILLLSGLAAAAESSGDDDPAIGGGERTKKKKLVPKAMRPSQPPDTDDDSDDDDSDDGDSDDGDSEDGDYGDEDDGYDEEYESKIEEALVHHASKSPDLMERALKEGAAVEIGADGDVDEKLWRAEFALEAMGRQLDSLLELQRSQYGSGDGSGDDGDDDEDYGGSEDFEYTNYDPTKVDTDPILKDDPGLVKILDAIDDDQTRNDLYGDVCYEADKASKLNPEKWYEFKYWELHAYFGCARVFGGSRPVYDAIKWEDLRLHWREFVVKDVEEMPIPKGKPERAYQLTSEEHDPPLVPFQTKEKGRGLKAGRDIAKGELIFKGTNNTVVFTHGHTWRKFLFDIYERPGEDEPLDAETTCDVLVWSWVQTLEEDGDHVIVADFDNGSLLNEGRDEKDWEPPNVRCGKEGDTICYMEYYATQDIQEGDELLCDYRGFALLDAWKSMGL